MVNTRYVSDLIEKGEIGQIKEAMEKSLSPGSQSFEAALLQLLGEADQVLQVEVGVGVGAGIAPPGGMNADWAHERAEP